MFDIEKIKLIKSLLYKSKDIGGCFAELDNYLQANMVSEVVEEFDNIKHDYHLMLDFIGRGFKDPKREDIYISLLYRLDRLIDNIRIKINISEVEVYRNAATRASLYSSDFDSIKHSLENFVTDLALVGLEPEGNREAKSRLVYQKHQKDLDGLFNQILVSSLWGESEYSFYSDLLTSPIIDSADAQLLISAITISCLNVFDFFKFKTLIKVASLSSDIHIHARSLVGWVLSLPVEKTFYDDQISETVKLYLTDDNAYSEIIDLQKQIFYCMNVDSDIKKIETDIMPNLTQNSNLNITRFGISEKESDTLNDILHSGEEEEKIEKAEASFRKMMDMQKQGSDIFFGGFAKMKSFPFFQTVSNWFMPFYSEHPEIVSLIKDPKDKQIFSRILEINPFCSSDKYSFMLALSSVIRTIPAEMKELLGSSSSMAGGVVDIDQNAPSFIRRSYLQDLFRFYRIYRFSSSFVNPFSDNGRLKHYLFIIHRVFRGIDALYLGYLDLAKFLYKNKSYKNAEILLDNIDALKFSKSDRFNFYMLAGLVDEIQDLPFATSKFEKALEIDEHSEKTLKCLARNSFNNGKYEDAYSYSQKLVEYYPNNKSHEIYFCLTSLYNEHVEEGVQRLFKLNFEYPEDTTVMRVLAWGLMLQQKVEQAQSYYDTLVADKSGISAEDLINRGYSLWIQGKMPEAIQSFKSYFELKKVTKRKSLILSIFHKDKNLLYLNHVTDIDMNIMSDLLA